jgi:hypothetical protein
LIPSDVCVYDDGIDQQQPIPSGFSFGVSDADRLAQSFTPSLNVLTKLQVRMFRVGLPDCITISIRSELDGVDLTSCCIDSEDIDMSSRWVTFDTADIALVPNETYYIIWTTQGSISNTTTFYWDLSDKDPYALGCAWQYNKTWEMLDIDYVNDPDFCFKTYGIMNQPPLIPTKPSGFSSGQVDSLLCFKTHVLDPNGDKMSVLFDWDDASTGIWVPDVFNGTVEQYHRFSYNGTYHIRVKAKDAFHMSNWSEPLIVVIGNREPNKPMTPVGPLKGTPQNAYSYTTMATDPDGHRLFYLFNWDDGSQTSYIGPFDSGQNVTSIHTWSQKGTYNVKVKVCDDPNGDGDLSDGIESVWSDPLEISLPHQRSHIKHRTFFDILSMNHLLYSSYHHL